MCHKTSDSVQCAKSLFVGNIPVLSPVPTACLVDTARGLLASQIKPALLRCPGHIPYTDTDIAICNAQVKKLEDRKIRFGAGKVGEAGAAAAQQASPSAQVSACSCLHTHKAAQSDQQRSSLARAIRSFIPDMRFNSVHVWASCKAVLVCKGSEDPWQGPELHNTTSLPEAEDMCAGLILAPPPRDVNKMCHLESWDRGNAWALNVHTHELMP